MAWIQTYTGRQFWPLQPQPDHVDIRDIAHSLALQCRFNGHCRAFYSVAQHSVLVSHAVPPADALWGLLHDAAEAYISDLPRPLKKTAPDFRQAEERLLAVIMAAFGLPPEMPAAVAWADDALLATELRDLMLPPAAPWGLSAEPLALRVQPVAPDEAEALFLQRFRELTPLP